MHRCDNDILDQSMSPEPSADPKRNRQRAETKGRRAEYLAAWILRAQAFEILTERFKAPSGEIDVIARRGRLLLFVEVKTRPTLDAAIDALSYQSRRRIEKAAANFLTLRPDLAKLDMRYDIFAIAGWRWRHVKNAWLEGE